MYYWITCGCEDQERTYILDAASLDIALQAMGRYLLPGMRIIRIEGWDGGNFVISGRPPGAPPPRLLWEAADWPDVAAENRESF